MHLRFYFIVEVVVFNEVDELRCYINFIFAGEELYSNLVLIIKYIYGEHLFSLVGLYCLQKIFVEFFVYFICRQVYGE